MVDDLVETLANRLSGAVNRLNSLTPLQKIQVQTLMARTIKTFVEEKGDPFLELTQSLGPTFDRITAYEKTLKTLVDELQEAPGSGKMVKDAAIRRPVTVRSNHRIVLHELPIGTVLGKTLYRSKRDDSLKGVMLEVI